MDAPSPNAPAGALTPERLTEQIGWLRSLARGLVRDEHLAEELAQDTLATALEQGPVEVRSVRAWLGRVLRNRAAENARSRANARDRESLVARGEAFDGEELLERVRAQKHVAEALMELKEPYRSTLVLRFYENLPPRAIAKRQGVPVSTVKSRLQRGMDQLKSELDSRYGSRRQWILAVLPIAHGAPIPPPTDGGLTLAGTAMNLKIVLAASAALIAGTWVVLQGGDDPIADDSTAPLALENSNDGGAGSGRGSRAQRDERPEFERTDVDPRFAATGAGADVQTSPTAALRGRVFDGSGQPVEGLRLGVRGESTELVSGADGWFGLEERTTRATIEVADEAWETVLAARWSLEGKLEPVLVAAPKIAVGGRVVDTFGYGIEGVRLEWSLPANLGARIDADLGSVLRRDWRVESDAEGRFDWDAVPAVPGTELRLAHPDYVARTVTAPESDDVNLELRLIEVDAQREGRLSGRVLGRGGLPLGDAWVQVGFANARTDKFGRFRLTLPNAVNAERLVAVAEDYQPVEMEAPGNTDPESNEFGWPPYVEVFLEQPSLSIRGRVVGSAGEPVVGARVWPRDTETFGAYGTRPLSREGLAAGAPLPADAVGTLAQLGADPEAGLEHGSATPVGPSNAMFCYVTTDAEGRFEVRGLSDREYRLAVLDSDVASGLSSDPIAAGSHNVELVVPAEGVYTPLKGRVVTAEGLPVPNVAVTPFLSAYRGVAPVYGGSTDVTRFFLGKAVFTDDEGRFTVASVPRQHVSFHLISDDIPPSYASVDDVSDPEDFVIQVEARAQLTVEAATGPEAPTAFRVLDVDGEAMQILEMRADGYTTHYDFALSAGRSGVVTVTTAAATLVWLRDDEVLGELPLFLQPGENGTLQY
ncbi:MAG: RNA polymerase sigma factor [Planctomycetota bacterium]|jgi:RNA polymerase sigma-70 factor (ECF subfamily)